MTPPKTDQAVFKHDPRPGCSADCRHKLSATERGSKVGLDRKRWICGVCWVRPRHSNTPRGSH
jgi:hypothetical protein